VSGNPKVRKKALPAISSSLIFAGLLLGTRAFEYFGHWAIGHGGIYATAIYLPWIAALGGCLAAWVLVATLIDRRSGGGSFRVSALAILSVIGALLWIVTHPYR
jgi:hypothetical protein